MAIITREGVQQWLSDSKSPVPNPLPPDLVKHAKAKVFGALKNKYDTSSWVDVDNTPDLVRSLVSMEVAGRIWLATYPTPADKSESYGRWLIKRVDVLLMQLAEGEMELQEQLPSTSPHRQPSFFPDDRATKLFEEEGDVEGAAPMYFRMGKAF